MLFVHAHICMEKLGDEGFGIYPWIYCTLRGYAILGFAAQTNDLRFAQQNRQILNLYFALYIYICKGDIRINTCSVRQTNE